MKIYISFGQDHEHVIDDIVFDKDCLACIEATSHRAARDIAFSVFGPVFATSYLEEDLPKIIKYFPRGIIELSKQN